METMYAEDVQSEVRTASYVSFSQVINSQSSNDSDIENYTKLRKRQLKDISKMHARDIVTLKINRKLAEATLLQQQ